MNMLQTDHRFAELAGDLTEGELDTRPPIVLLHGLTFDRTMWGPALSQLERIDPGRRTLTLDLPGHGQSAEVFRGLDEVVAAAACRCLGGLGSATLSTSVIQSA